MREELEKLRALFEAKYPSSLHDGIGLLKMWTDGSGIILHGEMEAFEFQNISELIAHLIPDEGTEESVHLKSPEYYLNVETGDIYVIWWTGNRPTGKDFVKISQKVYIDLVK